MDYRLIVYDDFFMHPNEIRKKALEQTFNQLGNYPGIRTDQCKNILPEMYRELKLSLEPLIPKNSTITARFQKQGKNDYRKIHQDVDTFLTCIVYLDETPMPNSGTGFYTHKETGWDGGTKKPDSIEVLIGSDFKRTSVIENKINRMIMYNGNLVHRAEEAGNERLTLILGVYK